MSYLQGTEVSPDLIRAAAAGDAVAHEAIYKAYQRPVYSLIRRLIARPAVADDLFQEVFIEILRSIRAYSGEGSFSGWVRSIAVSKCLMYLRSPWHRSLLWLDAGEGAAVDSASAYDAMPASTPRPDVEAEACADAERALAGLPALTRTVVWLHDVEGYTHGEIGRLLGRTASFSKSQLARAHVRMREVLERDHESVSCTPVSTNC